MLKQDIVYWGNPQDDGFGKYTFDPAVELKGRWEDVKELVKDNKGEEVLSRARVWLDQEVDEGGYIYLGTKKDSAYRTDPQKMEHAMQIFALAKIPELGSTTKFILKAHLNMPINRTI